MVFVNSGLSTVANSFLSRFSRLLFRRCRRLASGLSLVRNDGFHHHSGVTAPGLPDFNTTPVRFPDPFDSWLLRSALVSRPARGDLNARNPFSVLLLSAAVIFPGLHSPLGLRPAGSKRSAGFSHCEPALATVRYFRLPNRRLSTASRSAAKPRFRPPQLIVP